MGLDSAIRHSCSFIHFFQYGPLSKFIISILLKIQSVVSHTNFNITLFILQQYYITWCLQRCWQFAYYTWLSLCVVVWGRRMDRSEWVALTWWLTHLISEQKAAGWKFAFVCQYKVHSRNLLQPLFQKSQMFFENLKTVHLWHHELLHYFCITLVTVAWEVGGDTLRRKSWSN